MNDLLREHFEEHPEEYQEIQNYLARSKMIEDELAFRRKEKLNRIEECRRLLNEKHSV